MSQQDNNTVRWGKERGALFLGRNGEFSCTGIDAYVLQSTTREHAVMITPFTGRGDLARCNIEIPASQLRAVIKLLEEKATELMV